MVLCKKFSITTGPGARNRPTRFVQNDIRLSLTAAVRLYDDNGIIGTGEITKDLLVG